MPWNRFHAATSMSCLIRPRASQAHSTSRLSKVFLKPRPSNRAFHASPRPQFLETVILPVHSLFEGVHTLTGLPWVYSIPLAALSIRTIFVLPISIYTRRITQKQAALAPLVQSWDYQLRKDAIKEVGHLGPSSTTAVVLKKLRQKRKELYRRWSCELWKGFLPIIQLPVFLVAVECLRKMCGTHEGLLGLLVASISGGDPTVLVDGAMTLKDLFEPGFITGGALWFPDLTKADPELRLPFILSGVMLFSLVRFSRSNLPSSVWQKRIRGIMATMALAAGPLLLNMPSAMLVYWISSSVIAQAQGFLLNKLMPINRVSPCQPRKPLRIGRAMANKIP
ncbi:Uncharacterized protein BP5553_05423 [Venustampulla echinocandica]|uniref:Membrane insertase YidC/Oxa/ALB C-terminal domain-containing protein n=1 Tax=Venustampulla echinocandica TaxID=2656787 RepID=A0A370TR33_9HELO|nr:Uncharacterized protein BP5553_05423 [Venustampulla echinocandica]RDL37990.1 Uncharacterized protein BP5553_05423 [Venustampulla echinocandica]